MYSNPRLVFEKLFGVGANDAERQARREESRSLLDSVTGQIASLQKDLPASDRRRLSQYLDDVREIERRIQRSEASARSDLALPELPLHATCVRVPVLVGHAQAVWVETKDALSPEEAAEAVNAAPHVMLADLPTPLRAAGRDEVLVGRIRRDTTEPNGLALWIVNDNLRKGAALNAVQIAEHLLERRLLPV